jgi:hypothetical protein
MRFSRTASMRVMTVTALLALSLVSSAANAQDKAAPEGRNPKAFVSRSYTTEESAVLAIKAWQKAEALERARAL